MISVIFWLSVVMLIPQQSVDLIILLFLERYAFLACAVLLLATQPGSGPIVMQAILICIFCSGLQIYMFGDLARFS